jgi:hypothetical protein
MPHLQLPGDRKGPDDILTDYMGLPLSRQAARDLRDQANRYLKKSPTKIAEYANRVMAEKHPTQADKIFYTAEDFA